MADNYDYLTEKQRLDFQRALANQLQSASTPDGQMVSGWYVGPGKGAIASSALQNVMGALLARKSADDEAALNKQDRENYSKYLGQLLNPDTEAAKTKAYEQVPIPKADLDGFIARNMDRWNAEPSAPLTPTPSSNEGAQATPVAPPPAVQARPLPQLQVPPTQAAPQAPARPTIQQIEAQAAAGQPQATPVDPMQQLDALHAERDKAVQELKFYRTGVNRAKDPQGAMAAEQKIYGLDDQIRKLENQIAPAAGALKRSFDPAAVNPPPMAAQPPATPPQAPVAAPTAAVQPPPQLQVPQRPAPAALPPQLQAPQTAPQMPAPPQAVPQVQVPQSGNSFDGFYNPSQAEMDAASVQRLAAAQRNLRGQQLDALTGLGATRQGAPLAAQLTQNMISSQLMGDRDRYSTTVHADPVNGGFIAVKTDKKTGDVTPMPIAANGTGKGQFTIETDENGNKFKVYRSGAVEALTGPNGQPLRDANIVDKNNNQDNAQADKKAKMATELANMRAQLQRLIEVRPLIEKVGTGRLKGPWNELRAYVTNSDDWDNMNRAFNAQQLDGARTWLQGQGTITNEERNLLARAQFDPKASTESNLASANTIITLLQKHLAIAEQNYNSQFGSGSNGAAPTSTGKPKPGFMYSWQK